MNSFKSFFLFFFSFLKYFGGASTPTGLLSQQPSARHLGGAYTHPGAAIQPFPIRYWGFKAQTSAFNKEMIQAARLGNSQRSI